jgi:hypothetical protein
VLIITLSFASLVDVLFAKLSLTCDSFPLDLCSTGYFAS